MTDKPIYRQYQSGIHLPFTVFLLALVVFGISPLAAVAETSGQKPSASEVARELANPNSSLATLTLKNQYRWYTGDLPGADDQDNYTMVFQPVFPLSLPKDDSGNARTLFIRPGFPLLFEQPVPQVENGGLDWDGVTALGDIGFDIGYGVSAKSGFLWAFGMVGTLPTATDSDVAGKQLRLGPEFLLAKFEKWGLYGIFPSHQWNVTGWSGESFSTTQFQPVLKFLLGDGWTVGSSPIGFYNWESSEWTIPINLSASKTVIIGKTPWKFELEANYYVEQPDAFGPQWMIGFSISPVVKNPFQSGFNRLIGAN
ncbi:MAG: hypothetical protein WBY88_13060 [Desulfosarcina sp.]